MQHKLRDERSEYEGAGIDRQSYDDNAPGHPLEHTDILADGETGIGENDGAECKEIHFAYIIRDEIRHRRNRRRYEDGQNGHPEHHRQIARHDPGNQNTHDRDDDDAAAAKKGLDWRNAIARKAAKQRAAISAAEQIAETALLAVRIFSEAVKTAGIYGIILGAAGLAFVIARIAAVRAQAKAAQADTGFKEGTPFVEGPGGPKDDRISARLSRGERVVPADLNERMGGRRLTNEELFKYYELGRRVSQRKEIAIPVAATSARASKDRAALEVAIMQHAYAQASDKAADKMIAYWKTRPVEKVVGGQKVIEWQEGSGVRRQRIKKS